MLATPATILITNTTKLAMNMILISIGGHVLTAALLLTNFRIIHLVLSQLSVQNVALIMQAAMFCIVIITFTNMMPTSIGKYVPTVAFLLNGSTLFPALILAFANYVKQSAIRTFVMSIAINMNTVMKETTGGYVLVAAVIQFFYLIHHRARIPLYAKIVEPVIPVIMLPPTPIKEINMILNIIGGYVPIVVNLAPR